MVIEDPFEDRAHEFSMKEIDVQGPSRSPSPERDDGDDSDKVYLEDDDVNLVEVAQTKTSKELKEEKEELEAK